MTITPMPEETGSNLPVAVPAISSELATRMEEARSMAAAGMLPRQYQQQPANIFLAQQYAIDLGLPITTVFTGIHVIEGKPSASSALIGALIQRAGHRIRFVEGTDSDGPTVTCVIIRRDDPEWEHKASWNMAKAKQAGLLGKNVWKQYPEAMLEARALTACARKACTDALFGVHYTPEELGAEVDQDGNPLGGASVNAKVPQNTWETAAPAALPSAPRAGAVGAPVAPPEPAEAAAEPPAKAKRTRKPKDAPEAAGAAPVGGPAEDEVVDAELVMEDKPLPTEDDRAAAERRAGQALLVGDLEELRDHYRGAQEAGLLGVDVKAAVERPERMVLGIRGQDTLPLQQALVAMSSHVRAHGMSVADYLDANPEQGNTQGQQESSWGHPNPA